MANGRDSRGRFVKGNQHGKLNGGRRRVEFDRQMLIDETIPPERWARMLEAQVQNAEAGDSRAFQILWEFRFGKAKETVEATVSGGVVLILERSVPRPPVDAIDDDDQDR